MMGDTWTTDAELDALAEWGRSCRLMVEIGTWTGRSAEALVRHSTGKLYCVDDYKPHRHYAYEMLNTFQGRESVIAAWHDRVGTKAKLLEMESREAAAWAKENLNLLDLVFIDGSHDEWSVIRDIRLWKPLLRNGGLLCGHDYRELGVFRAVNSQFKAIEEGPGQLWSIRV